MDAEYNSAAEVFMIKELELHEISVVSVPANQNTLFSLSKAFDDVLEYKQFNDNFINLKQLYASLIREIENTKYKV